jgi:hypothetical protein
LSRPVSRPSTNAEEALVTAFRMPVRDFSTSFDQIKIAYQIWLKIERQQPSYTTSVWHAQTRCQSEIIQNIRTMDRATYYASIEHGCVVHISEALGGVFLDIVVVNLVSELHCLDGTCYYFLR